MDYTEAFQHQLNRLQNGEIDDSTFVVWASFDGGDVFIDCTAGDLGSTIEGLADGYKLHKIFTFSGDPETSLEKMRKINRFR